jgi:guanine nucleotide-binding protein subunit alpha
MKYVCPGFCFSPINGVAIQKTRAKKVFDYRLPTNGEPFFPNEIAEAIHELWKDPIMPEFMEKHAIRSAFCLMDSAA